MLEGATLGEVDGLPLGKLEGLTEGSTLGLSLKVDVGPLLTEGGSVDSGDRVGDCDECMNEKKSKRKIVLGK